MKTETTHCWVLGARTASGLIGFVSMATALALLVACASKPSAHPALRSGQCPADGARALDVACGTLQAARVLSDLVETKHDDDSGTSKGSATPPSAGGVTSTTVADESTTAASKLDSSSTTTAASRAAISSTPTLHSSSTTTAAQSAATSSTPTLDSSSTTTAAWSTSNSSTPALDSSSTTTAASSTATSSTPALDFSSTTPAVASSTANATPNAIGPEANTMSSGNLIAASSDREACDHQKADGDKNASWEQLKNNLTIIINQHCRNRTATPRDCEENLRTPLEALTAHAPCLRTWLGILTGVHFVFSAALLIAAVSGRRVLAVPWSSVCWVSLSARVLLLPPLAVLSLLTSVPSGAPLDMLVVQVFVMPLELLFLGVVRDFASEAPPPPPRAGSEGEPILLDAEL